MKSWTKFHLLISIELVETILAYYFSLINLDSMLKVWEW